MQIICSGIWLFEASFIEVWQINQKTFWKLALWPAGEYDGELGDDVEDVDDDLVDGARLLVEDAAEERLVQVADVRLVQRVHRVHLLRVADLRLQEGN